MPLIHLGQAAWDMLPDHGGGVTRTRQESSGSNEHSPVGDGAGFSRNHIETFARSVESEIRSAKGSGLTAGSASTGLLVLVAAEPRGAAKRRQRAGRVSGAWPASEFTVFTGSLGLENLAAAASGAGLRFLICGHAAGSLPGPAHSGYAATLVAAGMLANAIVLAALNSGWPASMDFAPEYDVTEAARQVDRLATHIATVCAYPPAGSDHE